MALVSRNFNQLSDLVLHEKDPSVGYAREVVFVDVASDTPVKMGAVAFRVKGAVEASYALLTNVSQLVTTNEFVVLFGDEFGCQTAGWSLLAAETADNAVGFVRDNVILKDYLVKVATTGVLDATQFEYLRHLLKQQNVILEITV